MRRSAAVTWKLCTLAMVAALVPLIPVSGPWGVLATIVGSATMLLVAPSLVVPAFADRALTRRWLVGLIASLAAVAMLSAAAQSARVPLTLPASAAVYAVVQCALAAVALRQDTLLGLARLFALAPLVWLTAMVCLVPAQLPVHAAPASAMAACHGVIVATVLAMLLLVRRGAPGLLRVPLLVFVVSSGAGALRCEVLSQPSEYAQIAIDPSRDLVARPEEVMAFLALREGDHVADVGAGGGYFTTWLAREVGPSGGVVATDVDYDLGMRDTIERRLADATLNPHDNVRIHAHPFDDVQLPAGSLDLAFLSQVGVFLAVPARLPWVVRCRHLPWPPFLGTNWEKQTRLVESIGRALKPCGRLAVIDLVRDPDDPLPESKVFAYYAEREQDVIDNFEVAGFRLVRRSDLYQGEEQRRARARFLEGQGRHEMIENFVDRPKFFLLFEKEAGCVRSAAGGGMPPEPAVW